jgi:pimeloyl-ACP methyl ester carboxylesterase
MQTKKHLIGYGGVNIQYTIIGDGTPVLLVHGFLSSGAMNWIDLGIAAKIAVAGYQVIVPDLRGHGRSDAPETADAYPPDILALDMEALLAAENCADAVLIGYSLGARTVVRMIARGSRPARAVLGGMGLSGILQSSDRRDYFITAIENRDHLQKGETGYEAAKFLKTTGTNPHAAIHVLRSQISSTPADLAKATMSILVIAGDTDHDNGSAAELAQALPHGAYMEIKGNHMTAVGNPSLASEIIRFLQS